MTRDEKLRLDLISEEYPREFPVHRIHALKGFKTMREVVEAMERCYLLCMALWHSGETEAYHTSSNLGKLIEEGLELLKRFQYSWNDGYFRPPFEVIHYLDRQRKIDGELLRLKLQAADRTGIEFVKDNNEHIRWQYKKRSNQHDQH